MKFFISFLALIFILSAGGCQSLSSSKSGPKRIPVLLGQVYYHSENRVSPEELEEIRSMMDRLVEGILKRDLSILVEFVYPKEGLLIDYKGKWSREEVKRDLANPEGYFAKFFLGTASESSRETVADLFSSSGEIYLDYYFDTIRDCELGIRFTKNPQNSSKLIHPFFRKFSGRWYIVRMF